MLPAVVGLASGTILLLSRGEDLASPHPLPSEALEVPLGLTRKQWLAFLRVATCGNPRTVSPSFRLGVFGLTVRRLCDLGAMAEPRVIKFAGRQVFDADWVKPASLRSFQDAPMLQYQLFVDSIERYADSLEISKAVGLTIDDKQLSLSGVLMAANRAGLPGMSSWLTDPQVRHRFRDNTTAFVEKANGIF